MTMFWTSGSLWVQLNNFSSVQELYVGIKAGIGNSRDGDEASITSTYIVPIFTHLPSQDALAKITLRLEDAGGHQGPKRDVFIGELSSHRVDQLLESKFSGLAAVHFQVPERSDSAYDAEWWQGQLDEQLSKLRGVASVSVHTFPQGNWRYGRQTDRGCASVLTACSSAHRNKLLCWSDDDEDSNPLEEGWISDHSDEGYDIEGGLDECEDLGGQEDK